MDTTPFSESAVESEARMEFLPGEFWARPRDQLFFEFNPWLYIFDFQTARQTFAPVWMTASQSNSALVYTQCKRHSRIRIRANGRTRFYEYGVTPTQPQVPWDLQVRASAVRASICSGSRRTRRRSMSSIDDTIALLQAFSPTCRHLVS